VVFVISPFYHIAFEYTYTSIFTLTKLAYNKQSELLLKGIHRLGKSNAESIRPLSNPNDTSSSTSNTGIESAYLMKTIQPARPLACIPRRRDISPCLCSVRYCGIDYFQSLNVSITSANWHVNHRKCFKQGRNDVELDPVVVVVTSRRTVTVV